MHRCALILVVLTLQRIPVNAAEKRHSKTVKEAKWPLSEVSYNRIIELRGKRYKLYAAKRIQEAIRVQNQMVEFAKRILPPKHPITKGFRIHEDYLRDLAKMPRPQLDRFYDAIKHHYSGMALFEKWQFGESIKHFNAAAVAMKTIRGIECPQFIATTLYLARCYSNSGQLKNARTHYNIALLAAKRLGLQEQPYYANALRGIAWIDMQSSDSSIRKKAGERLLRAQHIYSLTVHPTDQTRVFNLCYLALWNLEHGKDDQFEKHASRFYSIVVKKGWLRRQPDLRTKRLRQLQLITGVFADIRHYHETAFSCRWLLKELEKPDSMTPPVLLKKYYQEYSGILRKAGRKDEARAIDELIKSLGT